MTCYQGVCTNFGIFQIVKGAVYSNCSPGAFPWNPPPQKDGIYPCRLPCDGPGEVWSPDGNPEVAMDMKPVPGAVCISPCVLSGKAADPLGRVCTWCNKEGLPTLPPNDGYKFFADTDGSEVKNPTCTENPTNLFIRRDKPWG